jgi:hypothetical protein
MVAILVVSMIVAFIVIDIVYESFLKLAKPSSPGAARRAGHRLES